jgi:hypothetical protein
MILLYFQNEETSLSFSSEDSSYPIPVSHNKNLLNASQLEVHAGPLELSSHKKLQNTLVPNTANKSIVLSLQSDSPNNDISLNSSDRMF